MARILIVDDDPQTHHVLGIYLGSQGHQVRDATEPQEFLKLARAERPDLIIMDMQMPGGGAPMAQKMMEGTDLGEIPCLFISGMRVERMKEWFPAAPSRRYMVKPLSLPELGGVVKELLTA